MKFCVACLAVIALIVVPLGQAQDDAKNDQQLLQGTWTVTKISDSSKDAPADLAKKMTIIIADSKITMKLDDDMISERSFKLDAAKKPKQVDVTSLTGPDKRIVSLGIYELDGDSFKVCTFVGAEAAKQRPASFEDKTMPTSIMYMQRQKK